MARTEPIRDLGAMLQVPTVAALVVAFGCLGCRAGPIESPAGPLEGAGLPERPECDRQASPSDDLQALIDEASDGQRICLSAGEYPGPLVVARTVTLWGPREAVVRSSGVGTTIDVHAPGTELLGFSVDGSGDRYDTNDAAVRVEAADVRIEGLHIENALFGVLAEDATRLAVRRNVIIGDRNQSVGIGMRGDAIRFWSTTDSEVTDNYVTWGRDVVMWYSARNRLARNTIEHGRYGTHFMYSHECVVEDNRYEGNVVGVFVMYAHGIRLERNIIADSGGSGGLGLGLKDAGNVTVRENRFIHDRVAVHLDNSPTALDHYNRFERNDFRLGHVGVVFHGGQRRNGFFGNSFRDNHEQVRVDGGGDIGDVEWLGNHFDDYPGYDLDGDGYGDLPYALRRFSNQLTGRRPQLLYFRGMPALSLIDLAGEVVPLLQPETVLVDPRPRMAPPLPESNDAS